MNRHDGYFWLGLAPYWLRTVTALATIGAALPGLKRIDRVMISGTDDWSVHGPELMSALAYLAGAALVLVAGLVLGDILRLLREWQTQQLLRHEIVVSTRTQSTTAPLPTSQALLESLGIAASQPARVPFNSVAHRNR